VLTASANKQFTVSQVCKVLDTVGRNRIECYQWIAQEIKEVQRILRHEGLFLTVLEGCMVCQKASENKKNSDVRRPDGRRRIRRNEDVGQRQMVIERSQQLCQTAQYTELVDYTE